jgi:uncharacterized membrane protein
MHGLQNNKLNRSLQNYMADTEIRPKVANPHGMHCHLAGVLFPIIYLRTEPYKSNGFLRFHSFQSIVFTLCWAAVTITNDSIRFQMRGVNTVLSNIWLLLFVTWIVLMVKAYRGRRFKLPIVGNLATRWAGERLE